MIKKVMFLLLAVGIVGDAFAATYTYDKRKYVGAAWGQEPYSYVLQVRKKGSTFVSCTANMIAGKIVTAKHCLVNKKLAEVEFVSHDGRVLCANGGHWGKYEEGKTETYSGDWAVLEPCQKDVEYVKKQSLNMFGEKVPVSASFGNLRYIGCGALKIMSDEEIKAFKMAYYKYVYDNAEKKPSMSRDEYAQNMYNKNKDDSISVSSGVGKKFVANMTKYGLSGNIFRDTGKLKVSFCNVKEDPNSVSIMRDVSCQSWGGNSGGGLYMMTYAKDFSGKINKEASFFNFVGVHTRGAGGVGGKGHAGANDRGQDVTVANFGHRL